MKENKEKWLLFSNVIGGTWSLLITLFFVVLLASDKSKTGGLFLPVMLVWYLLPFIGLPVFLLLAPILVKAWNQTRVSSLKAVLVIYGFCASLGMVYSLWWWASGKDFSGPI